MTRGNLLRRGLITTYGAAVLLLLLGQWQPLVLVSASPEPWIMALSEAGAGKYRFGTDVVFTGGPLSDVYTRFFNPETFLRVLATNYLMVAVQLAALMTLVIRARSPLFALLLLAPLYFMLARDVQLMMMPLIVALVALGRPADLWSVTLTVLGALAAAVATLAKFSVLPLSIVVFLLVDISRLRHRRLPLATASYGIALYLSFLVFSAAGSDFRLYLAGSLAGSSAYSAAMAVDGPWLEFVLYGALLLAAALALFMVERRRLRAGAPFNCEAATQVLAILFFLWLTFKIGFVRHDLHVLGAFSALGVAVPLLGLARIPGMAVGRTAGALLAATVLLAGFFPHLRLSYDPVVRYALSTSLRDAALAGPREIGRSLALLAGPGAWLAEHLRNHRLYLATLAANSPIQELDGTVDTVPSLQAALIAAKLPYRPRPTIEEYTSYSPPLIQRNRAFFADADGPRFVQFQPATIDERYPAFAEGASWPIFLSHFAPRNMAGEGVLLRRRPSPIDELLTPPIGGRARMGAPLPVAFGADPVFLSIDVRPTLFGRLADLVFKPPLLYLGVTPIGRPEQVFRLIPGIAREGFIASPMIQTAWQYVLLAEGAPAERVAPIGSIRVFSGPGGDLSYRQQFTFTVRRVDRTKLAAARDWSLTPEQAATFERTRVFEDLIARAGGATPLFRIVADGLYAHAPRRFTVETSGNDRLTLGFGMRRGSWGAGSTGNGVCFRALTGDGGSALWERCVDPVRNPDDREVQRQTIALPVGTERVILETDCRGECGWDWSYWSEIAPLKN